MRILFYFFCFAFLGSVTSLTAQADKKFKLPQALNEASGLIIQAADQFWWQNDSGHPAILYQTDGEGQLTDSIPLPLVNRDWEDLTHDYNGTWYIGDFGNNCNCRKNLRIYTYQPETGKLDSILFSYPDQTAFPPAPAYRNFDMEGFVWFKDSLHLFSKNQLKVGNYYTKHYTLPASPGSYVAQLRDSIFLKKRVVTAAAISPDGEQLILLSYNFNRLLGFIPTSSASLFSFRAFEDSNFFSGTMDRYGIPPFFIATQMEAVDFWDQQTLYIASEKTAFIKARAKRYRLKPSKR
jgi:hypothetical protein